MPKVSQYPAMGDLTGTERLLGVQGADLESVSLARIAEFANVAAGGVSVQLVEAMIAPKADVSALAVEQARITDVESDVSDTNDSVSALDLRVDALEAGQAGGLLGYTTRALLFADLAHDANSLAFVTNDPTPSFNGTYIKVGGSGAGSWSKAADSTTALTVRVGDAEADIAAAEAAIDALEADVAELQEATGNLPSIESRVSVLESANPATFGSVSTEASSGTAQALPANPAGYTRVTISGQSYMMPYYALPTPLQGRFDAYYAPSFALNIGTNYLSRPVQTKPAAKSAGFANASYTDARFGTRIYHVTAVGDQSVNATMMRHDYSRRQAFNADSTKRIAHGSPAYTYLYDVATNARLDGGRTTTPGLGALGQGTLYPVRVTQDVFWHPTDPNKIWHAQDTSGSLVWREFDIVTKQSTVLFTINATTLAGLGLAGVTKCWFQGEGRPSDDGRWWFMSAWAGSTYRGAFMYDRQTNTITGAIPGTYAPNWTGTSPSGLYGIIAFSNSSGNSNGNNGLTRAQCAAAGINNTNGARAYNRACTTFTQLSNVSNHADFGYATDGTEVLVSANYSATGLMPAPIVDGDVYMVGLSDGAVWKIWNMYGGANSHSIHLSCTARNKPGYCLFSTYGDGAGGGDTKYDEIIGIFELNKSGTGKIYRIAHHQGRSGVDSYWYENHATWNDDGDMILWASNFNGSGVIDGYMAGIPSWVLP